MRIVVSVAIVACWTTIAVQSFHPRPPPHFDIRPRARGGIGTDLAMVTMGKNADDAGEFDILPRYGLGGADLSRRWIELIRGGHVSALATLSDNNGGNGGPATTTTVRYGVCLEDGATEGGRRPRLLEFVESPSSAREEGGGGSAPLRC